MESVPNEEDTKVHSMTSDDRASVWMMVVIMGGAVAIVALLVIAAIFVPC